MTDSADVAAEVVDRYFEAWNAPTEQRPQVVSTAFSDDAYYCDGAAEAIGHHAITDMMAAVMTQFEGARFEATSPIDSHHHQARFSWRMAGPDGETIIDGIDAIRMTDSGHISAALGFFGVDIPSTTGSTTAHAFQWERTYDVAAEQLFATVSDLDLYAAVAPNLSAIKVLSGEGKGMVRQCIDPDGASWTETYTEWVPGQRFVSVVDVSTYPAGLAAMIAALQMTVNVVPVSESQSTVTIDVATELTDLGLQALRDGGAADALFQPILDGWGAHLT